MIDFGSPNRMARWAGVLAFVAAVVAAPAQEPFIYVGPGETGYGPSDQLMVAILGYFPPGSAGVSYNFSSPWPPPGNYQVWANHEGHNFVWFTPPSATGLWFPTISFSNPNDPTDNQTITGPIDLRPPADRLGQPVIQGPSQNAPAYSTGPFEGTNGVTQNTLSGSISDPGGINTNGLNLEVISPNGSIINIPVTINPATGQYSISAPTLSDGNYQFLLTYQNSSNPPATTYIYYHQIVSPTSQGVNGNAPSSMIAPGTLIHTQITNGSADGVRG